MNEKNPFGWPTIFMKLQKKNLAYFDSSTEDLIELAKKFVEAFSTKHIAEVKAKYNKKRAELQRARIEAFFKLEKEFHDAIIKLNEEEKTELAG